MNKKMIKQLFPDLTKDDVRKLVKEEIEKIHADAKDVETVQYINPENTKEYINVKYDPIGNPYIIIK